MIPVRSNQSPLSLTIKLAVKNQLYSDKSSHLDGTLKV
jgi:hypothetical protein